MVYKESGIRRYFHKVVKIIDDNAKGILNSENVNIYNN